MKKLSHLKKAPTPREFWAVWLFLSGKMAKQNLKFSGQPCFLYFSWLRVQKWQLLHLLWWIMWIMSNNDKKVSIMTNYIDIQSSRVAPGGVHTLVSQPGGTWLPLVPRAQDPVYIYMYTLGWPIKKRGGIYIYIYIYTCVFYVCVHK